MKVIAVAGGSTSGKSLFAEYLAEKLQDSVIVPLDQFYLDKPSDIPFDNFDFDNPDVFDFDQLRLCLTDLASKKSTQIPQFDFITNTRKPSKSKVDLKNYVIVEGLYVLYKPEIRSLLDHAFFLESPSDVILSRRILRDFNEKNRSIDSCIDRYFRFIRPAYHRYIEPTKKYADSIVHNDFDTDLKSFIKNYLTINPL